MPPLSLGFDAIVGLAGLSVGLVGVLLSLYLYKKSLSRIELSYVAESTTLLGGSRNVLPNEISIEFAGNRILDLIKTNYIFWNSGNKPITKNELVPNSPINVIFDQRVLVLKASILRVSKPENDLEITANSGPPDSIQSTFQYLEPGQGFNIEIIYTGGANEPKPTGTIIGMPGGFRNLTGRDRESTKRNTILIITPFVSMFVIFGLFGQGIDDAMRQFATTLVPNSKWFWGVYMAISTIAVIGALLFLFIIGILCVKIRNVFAISLPNDLRT